MINELLFHLTAGLPCRLIKLGDRPYLERYYVGQAFGVTFYLHRFVSSDRERHLHNHPWEWGRALVLSGGYDEEVVVDMAPVEESGCLTLTRRIRWWNRVNGNHFHRIANAAPGTWTLFFHGPRVHIGNGMATRAKGWGFLERIGIQGPQGIEPLVVYKPHPPSTPLRWWTGAPVGRHAGREPLRF